MSSDLNRVQKTQLFFSLAWLHLREKLGVQKNFLF